jgi:putative hydrolase of the HAD superfamily
LDWHDFEKLHELAFPDFEKGRMTLDEYLGRTVFTQARAFSKEEFMEFMLAQSKEHRQTRAVLTEMAQTGRYFIGSINNEPLELNEYRIRTFKLQREFLVFFSSCYVGARKPEADIFRIALRVTQKSSGECLFIDDRTINLASPRSLGMDTIHYQNADQLRKELASRGIKLDG